MIYLVSSNDFTPFFKSFVTRYDDLYRYKSLEPRFNYLYLVLNT